MGGSGGSVVTPVNVRQLMTVAGGQIQATPLPASVVKANNTVLAVAGGNTIQTLRSDSCSAIGGYRYYPGFRGEPIILDFSQRLVFRLNNTPNPTFTGNGTLVFQEIGDMDV